MKVYVLALSEEYDSEVSCVRVFSSKKIAEEFLKKVNQEQLIEKIHERELDDFSFSPLKKFELYFDNKTGDFLDSNEYTDYEVLFESKVPHNKDKIFLTPIMYCKTIREEDGLYYKYKTINIEKVKFCLFDVSLENAINRAKIELKRVSISFEKNDVCSCEETDY